jgi:hypothetical protein
MMRLQQLNTKILGCLKNTVKETEVGNTILPSTEDRKGKVAAWDGATGALTYFGDGAMDEIYLKRGNNLSDVTDVDAAKSNLQIINGRELMNNGTAIPYRSVIDFSRAFRLINTLQKTLLSLNLVVANTGSGIPIVTKFSENTIWSRTLRVMGNLTMSLSSDGAIVIGDSSQRGWVHDFSQKDWRTDGHMVIPHSKHMVADDSTIAVTVRDEDGYDVQCDICVSRNGDVDIFSCSPFSGTVLIFGGIQPFSAGGGLVNPMKGMGDIIYSIDDDGMPEALAIGQPGQVLCSGSSGMPEYRTPGAAAWKNINIPGGLLQLDDDGEIPPSFLPINSMTYRGTFGSPMSSTGGDLPSSGVMDGDIYVADSDYSSSIAGTAFLIGQWAIFSGSGWDKVPFPSVSSSVPVGTVISHAGNITPQLYLPCNGYVLEKRDYPYLFSAIGDIYNTGGELDNQFSIPNYNNEHRILQGNTVAGIKFSPGLPNITGSFGELIFTGGTGPFSQGNLIRIWGGGGGDYHKYNVNFDASHSSQIYGASDTVQPPAQSVRFLIKYK